jgi:2-iminobutanoate/2-iminopropanoate deaminase
MPTEIISQQAPLPIGPYSQAIRAGDWLFISGQIPVDPQTNQLVTGDIQEQTSQVFKNIETILQAGGLDRQHVVKTTIYLTDMGKFPQINAMYEKWFTPPYPARAVVGVQALPKNAEIEIEVLGLAQD